MTDPRDKAIAVAIYHDNRWWTDKDCRGNHYAYGIDRMAECARLARVEGEKAGELRFIGVINSASGPAHYVEELDLILVPADVLRARISELEKGEG